MRRVAKFHQKIWKTSKCHLRILVAIKFIHGWNSKKRKHAQGCESPNAETWWWWGCLQTSATMELLGFGEFCSLTLHASFTLKPTCETCWNWQGITSWSFKKYHGAAFSKYSTSGWDSSNEIHPPEQKQQPNFSRLLVFSPSPSMGELTTSACFKLGCYPAAPRLWPPRLHA